MTSNPPTVRILAPTVLAGVLAVFVLGLTANVLDRDGLATIDPHISDWVVAHRNGVLTPIAIAVTHVGSTVTMTVLAVLAIAVFAWLGQRRAAALVVIAGLGSWLLVDGGKHLIDRPRPPAINHVIVKTNPAYPSGHSLGSIVVVGILALLLIPRLRRPVVRRLAAIGAAMFVVAVGLSRIYLGVHWPTDVLGGWAIGALWVLLCYGAYRYLDQRQDPVRAVPELRARSLSRDP
ncbi:phosphatase PAP2 family protein [Nocardia sp. NPDC049149]|uniref:phosphatase PAP2 family protein n=1 Tax=Nocardia sp. NPDC049149 TaxID=3364315 RepID=UPI00371472BF